MRDRDQISSKPCAAGLRRCRRRLHLRRLMQISSIILFASGFVEPVSSAPQIVEDLVNIRFQPDVRVFTVMAAINAGGFNLDSGDLHADPVREKVREHLSNLSPDLLQRLRDFYSVSESAGSETDRQSMYVSFALFLGGPPQFTPTHKPADMPAAIRPLVGPGGVLAELWKEGQLADLWAQVLPDYVSEAETYRPLLRRMMVEVLHYLHTEARIALDRQVTFIPDLLNGYGVVNARNIGSDYVIIVGPSRTANRPLRALRHEYLHFMIDPLVEKYFAYLPPAGNYLKKAADQPHALPIYKEDFLLMLTESLIRMVELRLDQLPAEKQSAELIDDYKKGLVLAPCFLEGLEAFEKRNDGFQDYFPELIRGIRWEAESRRGQEIARLKKTLEQRPQQTDAAGQPAASADTALRTLLSQANKRLEARDFEGASRLLEKVLQMDALNANALFGMAQVASQAQELERALDLYEKAAAHAGPDVWIAGWSYVRRGNIYRFLGDEEKARAEWAKALNLPGDSRGAAEAAKKALTSQGLHP